MDESSGMIWSFQVLPESKSPSGPRHSVIPLLAATLSGMLTMAGQNLGTDLLRLGRYLVRGPGEHVSKNYL